MRISSLVFLGTFAVLGCSQEQAQLPEPQTEIEVTEPVGPDPQSLEYAVANTDRSEKNRDRDQYRHPQETLDFCDVNPASAISEIWPGSGWYSEILLAWAHANNGHFNAVVLDPESSKRAADLLDRYVEAFSDVEKYGEFSHAVLSANSEPFAENGSQDAVLTFRNVHSWMSREMVEKAFADFYASLKPGGVLCVIEHRLPSGALQDPNAPSGYVQEAMVKALAKEAGFAFEEASEINANSKDTADHPFGVWTLLPVQRSPRNEEEMQKYPDFDRAAFDAIGESDRMTLRFRKPATNAQ